MPLPAEVAAAVEITALAAGAGPPANRMATRLMARAGGTGYRPVSDKPDMAHSQSQCDRVDNDFYEIRRKIDRLPGYSKAGWRCRGFVGNGDARDP